MGTYSGDLAETRTSPGSNLLSGVLIHDLEDDLDLDCYDLGDCDLECGLELGPDVLLVGAGVVLVGGGVSLGD